jgi:tetratricopeptide (TPR) repeat protein/O-antigen ligase
MEVVLLALVCLSPWAYGAINPEFELVLYAGVALMLVLWGLRMLLEGHFSWQRCPVAVCLAVLILLGIWQSVPWPPAVLKTLSPATSELYARFLPAQPERIDGATVAESDASRPGSTLSLYPGATRSELTRLLAVFLVFVLVRNNLTSVPALKRLSVVALVNGTLLALFALAQRFTSPPHLIYWSHPTPGGVFGPFICRNHYPYYLNLCLGLGLGLLLSARPTPSLSSPRFLGESWHYWLRHPHLLWTSGALVVMIVSIILSLSRGGFVALGGGLVVCLMLYLGQGRRLAVLGTALFLAFLTLALLAWLGFRIGETRLATLWRGEAWRDSRFGLHARVLPLAWEFPIWGTGLGTFRHVEPLSRGPEDDPNVTCEHAENEYLETLIEGGILQLALGLTAIGYLFRQGFRALRQGRSSSTGGLALGLLFGFTTVLIHNLCDFGLHVPAIALLATVCAAHLCALGDAAGIPGPDPTTGKPLTAPDGAVVFRGFGLAPVAGALTALALGLILLAEGWRSAHAEVLRLDAVRAQQAPDTPDRERTIRRLEEAVRWTPENASLHVALAEAHFERYQAERARDPEGLSNSQALVTALRHYLIARDLCPLLSKPQVRLAALVDRLDHADSRTVYLERAKHLRPADPELWYLAGRQELADGQPERAWQSWRRSLTFSDRYLADILRLSARHLDTQSLIAQVLPDRADILWTASQHPSAGSPQERLPFLEKAAHLLQQADSLGAHDQYLQARVYRELNRPAEAIESYRKALQHEPQQSQWRYELAELLFRQRLLPEAQRELSMVLRQQPDHGPARNLQQRIADEAGTSTPRP